MFQKILIANRGEIACRIIRTARQMGIRTVAVYSDADADALHTRMADEAVAIGPAQAAQSYLAIDRIVDACRSTGAEAVHPGYGFLSENPAFCEALQAAGIVFIGPGAAAMRSMGDKIASKKLAGKAGVSTIPGHPDAIADETAAVAVAGKLGFPVMLKASAGGGGKGMRIAHNEAEARDGFRSAANEARAAFGDDRIFIERYVARPRHIEIQVLADGHGTVLYLHERECSIQRRHQKVIEEAPSPFLDGATRRAMGEQAVALAKAVGYVSAGTVEFIVDAQRNFYFLEMNTRLQVEHPVTEMVTGLDLVEWQIRVAAGEPLPLRQDELRLDGWAIEARVYAEDPLRGFLPSTGRVTRYRPPTEDARIRVDTGLAEGSEVSMFYDPMIAKLVAHGPDRASAIRHLSDALDAFQIRGVQHNIPFLAAVAAHPRFSAGDLTTDFIAEEFPKGFAGRTLDDESYRRLSAIVAMVHRCTAERDARIGGGSADAGNVAANWVVRHARAGLPVTIVPAPDGWQVTVDGVAYRVASNWTVGERLWTGTVGGVVLTVQIDPLATFYRLIHGGATLDMQVLTPRAAELAALMPVKVPPDLSKFLLSPMPGLLVSVAVAEGQRVHEGQPLAVVEAMKMENMLRAVQGGRVAALHAKPGDSLTVDQKILEFE